MEDEANERHAAQAKYGHELDADVVLSLTVMMNSGINPFVHDSKSAAQLPDNIIKETKLLLKKDRKPANENARRYNLPSAKEVQIEYSIASLITTSLMMHCTTFSSSLEVKKAGMWVCIRQNLMDLGGKLSLQPCSTAIASKSALKSSTQS